MDTDARNRWTSRKRDSVINTDAPSVKRKKGNGSRPSTLRIAAGWMVHLYTACGVLVNFHALLHAFIFKADFHLFAMMNWLSIFIDATDGTLARAVDIKAAVPGYDGALLDNIIDYMTFSVLPSLAIVRFQLVPNVMTQYLLSSSILISSAYAFCQTTAKTSEAFVGFPSYWNIIVFYIYYLEWSTNVTVSVVLSCAVLSFVPIHFIYPTKTKAYMQYTLIGAYIWGVLLLFCSIFPRHSLVKPALYFSLIYVFYYAAMSLYLDYLRRKTA